MSKCLWHSTINFSKEVTTPSDKTYAELDRKLLEQFSENPQRAFRALFEAYHTQLCVYAVQLTDSFELAEEVVQDVFVYFWEKACWNKIADNLRGYLLTSTRNMALAHLRHCQQYATEDLSALKTDIPDESIDEEEWEERTSQLYADLEQLPEQEKAAIKAVVMLDKSYKVAAEEMGVSVNSLKTYLSRGLRKLRTKHNLLFFF